MKDTIIVGLTGAPGAGKSTGAAYIFSKLKMLGVDAELVTEFAKDKVWEENPTPFKNQAYMFGQQYYRLSRCFGKVDVIITDSPLPLSILYNNDPRLNSHFDRMVITVWKRLNTRNFFLKRVKPYNPNGRNQTEEEADLLSIKTQELYKKYELPVTTLTGCAEDYDVIVNIIREELITKGVLSV
jgi:adenylate kinase family enzyme